MSRIKDWTKVGGKNGTDALRKPTKIEHENNPDVVSFPKS